VSGFLSLGGYGAYVWPAYAIAAIVLGGLAAQSWRARARARAALDAAEAGAGRRERRR
jgi:heme exporter protein D